MKNLNSYQNLSGKKSGLIFIALLFAFIFLVGKLSAQDASGFAGISVPVKTNKAVGVGIETGFIGKNVGLGFQVDYIEDQGNLNTTSARLLLMWNIAENFQIKTAAGGEFAFGEDYTQGRPCFGIGPNFQFGKIYLGIQPNLAIEDEKLALSNVSFTLGMIFE